MDRYSVCGKTFIFKISVNIENMYTTKSTKTNPLFTIIVFFLQFKIKIKNY